jgi:hypothetical protein
MNDMIMKFQRTILRFLTIALIVCGYTSVAQQTDPIATSYQSYASAAAPEKVYVHSDKSFYVAGEIMWFKIYTVAAGSLKTIDNSKVAYVEILDRNNGPVLQGKISLKNGSGNGSFNIPVSLGSGVYKMRAYTSWMKNGNPDYFFEKPITIVNTFTSKQPAAAVSKNTYRINFFPEGGNLVQGLASTIAFKVSDQNGKGCDATGVVLNENNDSIAGFTTLKFGIGRFSFTPTEGSYKAVVTMSDGTKLTQNLPDINASGYVMSVKESNGNLQVRVQSKATNSFGEKVYVLIHANEASFYSDQISVSNGFADFTIPLEKLPKGTSHITIFNQARKAVCERLFFKRPDNLLKIEAGTDQQQYGTRKKIDVALTTSVNGKAPGSGDLSLAVYRLDSLQAIDSSSIAGYLLLSADLRGNIESPEYYLNNRGPEVDEALDNLMLTHGWRRFRWDEILSQRPSIAFLPELEGHIISGKVVHSVTGDPQTDVLVYLSVPGPRVQLFGARSDSEGYFHIKMKDFYGPNELVVQTNTRYDSSSHIELSNPFSDKFSNVVLPEYISSPLTAQSLLDHSVGVQVQFSYAGNNIRKFLSPNIDTTLFYGKPDKTYMLDEYTRFTTMEEVLREYIMEVIVRRREGYPHLMVLDMNEKRPFVADGLVLLDGMPVFDFRKLLEYDPLKVKKMDIVARRYFLGPLIFDGITSMTTYKGNLDGFEPDRRSLVVDYEGLQMQREFYSPVYDGPQQPSSRIPDQRNVLYWSPQINTDKDGKAHCSFYSSDLPGHYVVVVQGISADGAPGSSIIRFDVK